MGWTGHHRLRRRSPTRPSHSLIHLLTHARTHIHTYTHIHSQSLNSSRWMLSRCWPAWDSRALRSCATLFFVQLIVLCAWEVSHMWMVMGHRSPLAIRRQATRRRRTDRTDWRKKQSIKPFQFPTRTHARTARAAAGSRAAAALCLGPVPGASSCLPCRSRRSIQCCVCVRWIVVRVFRDDWAAAAAAVDAVKPKCSKGTACSRYVPSDDFHRLTLLTRSYSRRSTV